MTPAKVSSWTLGGDRLRQMHGRSPGRGLGGELPVLPGPRQAPHQRFVTGGREHRGCDRAQSDAALARRLRTLRDLPLRGPRQCGDLFRLCAARPSSGRCPGAGARYVSWRWTPRAAARTPSVAGRTEASRACVRCACTPSTCAGRWRATRRGPTRLGRDLRAHARRVRGKASPRPARAELLLGCPTYVGPGGRSWDHIRLILDRAAPGLGWPVGGGVLVKQMPTPALKQCGSWRERLEVASGEIRSSLRVIDPSAVAGRRVLVFDDVFTDGLTLHEVGRALRLAGARDVRGIVLARQPRLRSSTSARHGRGRSAGSPDGPDGPGSRVADRRPAAPGTLTALRMPPSSAGRMRCSAWMVWPRFSCISTIEAGHESALRRSRLCPRSWRPRNRGCPRPRRSRASRAIERSRRSRGCAPIAEVGRARLDRPTRGPAQAACGSARHARLRPPMPSARVSPGVVANRSDVPLASGHPGASD